MPTQTLDRKSTKHDKQPAKGLKPAKQMKPTELLKKDHRKVKELFEEFEAAKTSVRKKEIVEQTINELKVHTQVEEELFYPAARKVRSLSDLLDEAAEEHHVVDLLIAELQTMEPDDERYDAKYTVLAENVKHHIREEEGEMFPKSKPIDTEELGRRMQQRSDELRAATAID